MKKALATLVASAALTAGLVAAAPAAQAAPADGRCVKAGLATLKSLGAIPAAAQGKVDYSAFADAEKGPIFADLPTGSYLPLSTVIKLHQTSPELFAWCR